MSDLVVGDKVWVIDKRIYAKVTEVDKNPNF